VANEQLKILLITHLFICQIYEKQAILGSF